MGGNFYWPWGGEGRFAVRILAIDYGDVHTGAAVSDEGSLMAWHSEVITTRKRAEVLRRLGGLIKSYQIDELVLGYPLNMDGTAGIRAEKAEAFSKALEEVFSLPVHLWDERQTTVEAHDILFASGKNGKKRKKVVDAVAACLILEDYLRAQRG